MEKCSSLVIESLLIPDTETKAFRMHMGTEISILSSVDLVAAFSKPESARRFSLDDRELIDPSPTSQMSAT